MIFSVIGQPVPLLAGAQEAKKIKAAMARMENKKNFFMFVTFGFKMVFYKYCKDTNHFFSGSKPVE